MCKYIGTREVMPGYICCVCREYNGLQRTACKNCFARPHVVEVPPNVEQCASCGFGVEDGVLPVGNLAGQTFTPGTCPVCGEPWKAKSK